MPVRRVSYGKQMKFESANPCREGGRALPWRYWRLRPSSSAGQGATPAGAPRHARAREHHAGILLHRLVEILVLPRRLHVPVDDIDGSARVLRADVGGLLEGDQVGDGAAVLDIVRVLGAIALQAGHR